MIRFDRLRWSAGAAFFNAVLAIAVALLVGSLILYEASFNQTIAPDGDVYLVGMKSELPGIPASVMGGSNDAVAVEVRNKRPDWIVARISKGEYREVGAEGRKSTAEVFSADEELPKVLKIRAIAGDPGTALGLADGIVLTRGEAIRLFGRVDVLGSALRLDETEVTVRAIIEDWPRNSQYAQHRILLSARNGSSAFAALDRPDVEGVAEQFGAPAGAKVTLSVMTFGDVEVLVRAKGPRAQVEADIAAIAAKASTFTDGFEILKRSPYPLNIVRLNLRTEPGLVLRKFHTDLGALLTLALLALLGILSAALGIVSLGVAQAARRAREVAVLRAYGARAAELTSAELARYSLAGALSGLCAVALGAALAPSFGAVLDRTLPSLLSLPNLAIAMLTGALGGSICAIAPCSVLASGKPLDALRGREGSHSRLGLVRASLIVVQIALATVSATFALALGAQYAHNVDPDRLGFTAPGLATATQNPLPGATDAMGWPQLEALRARAATDPRIVAFASAAAGPRSNTSSQASLLPGGRTDALELNAVGISTDFFRTLGTPLLVGRECQASELGNEFPTGGEQYAVLNRKAALLLGFASPANAVGALIPSADLPAPTRIIGVVGDLRLFDLRQSENVARIFYCQKGRHSSLFARVAPGVDPAVAMSDLLTPFSANAARDAESVTTILNRTFRDVSRLLAIVGVAAVLNLLTAASGLIGLAMRLTMGLGFEASVRKAFGASNAQVLSLLAQKLGPWVGLGAIVGIGGAVGGAREYLARFPDPVGFNALGPLAVAALITLIFAAVVLFNGAMLARLKPNAILRVT